MRVILVLNHTNVFMFGWVAYRDVFPDTKVRVTEFCMGLTTVGLQMDSNPNNPRWNLGFTNCRNYNCTDEDCQNYRQIADLYLSTATPPTPPLAMLTLSYSPVATLPIVVSPGSRLYILTAQSNGTSSITTATNPETKEWYWPKKDAKPDFIGFCQIGNRSDKIIFNLLTTFGVHFRLPQTQHIPNKDYSLMGTVKPGDYVHIYLVNESSYIVTVDLPQSAVLEVEAQSGRTESQIIRRTTGGIEDQIPAALSPSTNKW